MCNAYQHSRHIRECDVCTVSMSHVQAAEAYPQERIKQGDPWWQVNEVVCFMVSANGEATQIEGRQLSRFWATTARRADKDAVAQFEGSPQGSNDLTGTGHKCQAATELGALCH